MRSLFFTFIFFLSFALYAQNNAVVLVGDYGIDQKSFIIDATGKIIATLPGGHKPYTNEIEVLLPNEIYVVKHADKSHYLINSRGEIVKDLGRKYHNVSRYSEGYCVAWSNSMADINQAMIYLDRLGNNAFGNKYFWDAHAFKNGLAAVQEKENGPWCYIDTTGQVAIRLDPNLPGKVGEIGPFNNGLARITMHVTDTLHKSDKTDTTEKIGIAKNDLAYLPRHYYIDISGKVALDLQKLFPNRHVWLLSDFSDQRAFITFDIEQKSDELEIEREFDIVMIDTQGKPIRTFPQTWLANTFVKGMAGVTRGGDLYSKGAELFDVNGKTIKPIYDHNKIKLIKVTNITAEYYILEGVPIINGRPNHDRWSAYVFSRKTNREIYRSQDGQLPPAGIDGNYMYVGNYKTVTATVIKLPENTIAWRTNPEEYIYDDFRLALLAKDKVRFFLLRSFMDTQITPTLFKLTTLEHLTLKEGQYNALPKALASLKNLKTLILDGQTQLTQISDALSQLPKLEELTIEDCLNLPATEIESIAKKCKALKRLNIVNMWQSEGLKTKLNTINPNLTVRNIKRLYSGEEYETP